MSRDALAEVRDQILRQLVILTEVIGPTHMANQVLPALFELAKDPKWRVRLSVIEQSAVLATLLDQKNWERRVQPLLMSALQDHCSAIRLTACDQIGAVTQKFGIKWCSDKILPPTFTMYDTSANYIHRMTVLMVISACAHHATPDLAEQTLLPLPLTGTGDDVPNVRVAAAKALRLLIPKLPKRTIDTKIRPALLKLQVRASSHLKSISHFHFFSLTPIAMSLTMPFCRFAPAIIDL